MLNAWPFFTSSVPNSYVRQRNTWRVIVWLIHWITSIYWPQSWPNVFAPSIWTLVGIWYADFRAKRRTRKLKQHHTDKADEIAGQIDELTRKLRDLLDD